MSEKEANSLAAELSLEDDRPPFFRLKNDLLVVVQVLREAPPLMVEEAELPIPKSESESPMLFFNNSSSTCNSKWVRLYSIVDKN